jgi:hypothetical protein
MGFHPTVTKVSPSSTALAPATYGAHYTASVYCSNVLESSAIGFKAYVADRLVLGTPNTTFLRADSRGVDVVAIVKVSGLSQGIKILCLLCSSLRPITRIGNSKDSVVVDFCGNQHGFVAR